MPTRREYLAGLNPPLAKANSRGRLSKAALAEVARAKASGVTFSDEDGGGSSEPSPSPRIDEPKPSGPVAIVRPDPIRRTIKHVEGYTPEGAKVQSGICFKCSAHVSRCACKAGIKASPIVARWSKESEQYGAPIDRPSGS
jgi:hypothetical protein